MCWKTGVRTVGILGVLVLSPFTLADNGPGAATVCASVADECVQETGSVCWEVGGAVTVDHGQRNP